jgi:oligoribonuclease
MTERLVWIDCEMTGLDLARDALVEVAVLVTDSELEILDDGFDVLIAPPPRALEAMVPVVRDMHSTSGLLEALAGATTTLAEAQEQILGYVRRHVPDRRKAPLCGNSIATDRAFLARDMPALDDHLHYRMIDVSSVKELCRRWYPKVYYAAPEKHGGHRALADIVESVAELRYYRSTIFVPPPGPAQPSPEAAARPLPSTVVPD